MTDVRTSALGLYHYAHSYAASAAALSGTSVTATHADAPVRFLYRHAVELYLKAFLLHKMVPYSQLAGRALGHSTKRLVERAVLLGLPITAQNRKWAEALDDSIADRYLETGVRRVLTAQQMLTLCGALHGEIGVPIYIEHGLRRRLPILDC